ncbi:DsbA family protein [Hyphomonas sp.]|uniref:DsbA family protein n=1 Tax=Hyphomonas sp. TaxID=87 RepID=UPI001DC267C2|nr:DsbA family protein [Hyphomonas sp.]MBU3919768.1 DsbA family protein [Alphaproteobacteria bacterium]MBU4062640.1 DsbA family protein [Alphaproteobacteria bacterium]MBU4163991.1 DsbA family protein [Alphaproteobacteria bacterium]
MASLSRRLALLALPALALVACGAANGDGNTAAQDGTNSPSSSVEAGELGHIKGDSNAPVTLIEYASPTCPACKYFHDSILPEIEAKYISTGKVKFVFREFPIHGAPDVAAYVVARCAGDDKYFDVLDDLFTNQEGIVQAAQVGALGGMLKTVAQRHGIETTEAFDACMADRTIRDKLAAVYQTAEQYSVNGTPTFILDGKVRNFEGDYRSPEGFSRQIDAVLAEKGVQ